MDGPVQNTQSMICVDTVALWHCSDKIQPLIQQAHDGQLERKKKQTQLIHVDSVQGIPGLIRVDSAQV